MRKILLFLVLLGLVFSLEVEWEISKLPDYISKPWEGYWVNIYYKNGILSTEMHHPSLDGLALEAVNAPDTDVLKKINYAKQQYAIATAKKQQCEYYFVFKNGGIEFGDGVIDRIYEKARNAYEDARRANDTVEAAKAYGCVLFLSGWGGATPGSWLLTGGLCAAYISSDITNSYKACDDYDIYWKATMTASSEALERSAKVANERYDLLKEGYENLTWAGMCNENYTWSGKETCNGISQALLEAQAGSSSALGGHGGLRDKIKEYSEAMKSTGFIYTSNYSIIMGGIWNTAVPYTEAKLSECSTAMKNALAEYSEAKTYTQNIKSEAKEAVDRCTEEELMDFDIMVSGGKMEIGATDEIAEECESAENYYKKAEGLCNSAETAYNGKGEYWLLKAFQHLKACYENFENANGYATDAYESAKETVLNLRNFAAEAISSAEGKADPSVLQQAKSEFNAGESAKTLGDKAYHYKRAWDLAGAAMAAFVPQNKTDPLVEEQFNILKAEVEGMLSRAQADGIDVTTERSLYEYYVSLGPTEQAISGLRKVMEMILNKAMIAYGDLEYLREEIYERIESANGAFDYLLPELNALEAGYVKNGKIDFAAALGHLATIKEGYLSILEEIESKKEEAYSGAIIWTYAKDFEPARIDEKSQITMYIYATNPNAFTVAGGEKSFDFPFEVMQSDVSGELIGVVSDGKTLTLYPKDFGPFESRSFVVSTSQIVASTSNQEVYATGYDGRAYVSDSRLVEFLAPSEGLYLPDEWESVSIGGYEYNAGSGFINKKFSADFYEITGTYTVIDAYEWAEQNHNSITIGTTTTLSYDIVIDSKMHIDEMKFVVEGENINAYASGGASVRVSGNEVIVYNVDEGETTLHIKYEISNANEYINQKIKELHDKIDGSKCPEAEQALNNAILAYQSGDINTAMEKLKEAEALWEKYLREAQNAQAGYEKYLGYVNQQLEQITKALARADSLGLSCGFVDTLRERKTSIESFIAGLENLGIQEKANRVKEFDKNWLEKEAGKFLKDAFAEVGDKKKEYYKLGVVDSVLDGYFNEFEANYKKARASEADYTPHVDTCASLFRIRSAFEQTAMNKNSQLTEILSKFDQLKEEVGTLITQYTNEYNDGKKTPYESLFQFLPNYYSEKLSTIEKEVKKTDKPEEIAKRVEKLKKIKEELTAKLDVFKKSAEEMLKIVETEFIKAKPNLDGKTKQDVESAIETIRQNIANGRYVSAMNTANNVLITLGKVKSGGVGFVLWFGVLLLIAAGIFYYLRSGGKVNLGNIGIGGLFKEEKKEAKPLKKLERVK
ncbi:MAG: hypothetical protein ACPL06_02780 [Candidatus Anstonellales archaeon]